MDHELPYVQAGFRKGRGTRDQIANICWIIEKAREFQENIYFCFIDYAKAFDCVDYNKLWKILKQMGIPDHLTCLLRNLYACQEATVSTDMEEQTGSKSGKEYVKDVHCHPAYLTHIPTPKQKEMHMGELFQRNGLKYGNIPIMNMSIMVLIRSGKKLGND